MEAIIILAYGANVFLTRWLNKIDHQKHYAPIVPILWFLPIIGTSVFLCSLIGEWTKKLVNGQKNWFTGKNW